MSDQQPEALPKCDQYVFDHGVSLGFFDMRKDEAETMCKAETERTGNKHDWHYVAGRVHVKMLPACTAALLAERDELRAELSRLQAERGEVAPICTVYRGGLGGSFGKSTILQAWLPGCDQLPDGEHTLCLPAPLPDHADHVPEIAARLRHVAELAGCQGAVPADDLTAVGCIFSVLGSMRRALERKPAAPAKLVPLPEPAIRRIHETGACLPDLVGMKEQWPEILRFTRAIEAASAAHNGLTLGTDGDGGEDA